MTEINVVFEEEETFPVLNPAGMCYRGKVIPKLKHLGENARRMVKLASESGWICHYCNAILYPADRISCIYKKDPIDPQYLMQEKIIKPNNMEFPHVDHKTPRAKGGSNRIANLVLSCPACNMKKGTTPYLIFKLQIWKETINKNESNKNT